MVRTMSSRVAASTYLAIFVFFGNLYGPVTTTISTLEYRFWILDPRKVILFPKELVKKSVLHLQTVFLTLMKSVCSDPS